MPSSFLAQMLWGATPALRALLLGEWYQGVWVFLSLRPPHFLAGLMPEAAAAEIFWGVLQGVCCANWLLTDTLTSFSSPAPLGLGQCWSRGTPSDQLFGHWVVSKCLPPGNFFTTKEKAVTSQWRYRQTHSDSILMCVLTRCPERSKTSPVWYFCQKCII